MPRSQAHQWFLEASVAPKQQRIFVRKQMRELQNQYEFWDYMNLVFRRYQKKRCYYCGIKLEGYPTTVFKNLLQRNWEVDHKVAVYYGGTNAPMNLCIACRPCNREKGADLMERHFIPGVSERTMKRILTRKTLF